MHKVLAIFLIAFCAVAAGDPCGVIGRIVEDRQHCDRFYQCTNDGFVSIQCKPPTLFNPRIIACDWPQNVRCRIPPVLKSALEPCDNVGDLKPDPKYCNHFYECTNSGWASLECEPPTVFNPKILRCDWPENVDCAN